MKLFTRLQILLLVALLSIPGFSFAVSDSSGYIHNPLKSGNDNIFDFIKVVIKAALQIGAIVAVLAVIYAGFLFVTAQGDEKKIETAKKTLLYTVIGLAILLGAEMIATVVVTTINDVSNAAK